MLLIVVISKGEKIGGPKKHMCVRCLVGRARILAAVIVIV